MMQASLIRKRNPLRILACLGGGNGERGGDGGKEREARREV